MRRIAVRRRGWFLPGWVVIDRVAGATWTFETWALAQSWADYLAHRGGLALELERIELGRRLLGSPAPATI